MSIEIIDNKELWDDFINSSLNGTLFHMWDFLNIIERHSATKLLPFAIYNDEELLALFPLFFGKRAILRMIMSPPFSFAPYLGPVVKSGYINLKQHKKEGLQNFIVQEISDQIKNFSPDYITIKTTPGYQDIRAFKWKGFIADPYYTYTINLDDSLNEIWANFKKNCRKNIKEVDTKLHLNKSLDVVKIYDLIQSRYNEQGIKTPYAISPPYLTEITNEFRENLDIYYLYRDDQILTGRLIAKSRDTYMTWIGGSRINNMQGGNEYFIWELIKIAKSEGYRKFELFGANTINLCNFKSKFNPTLDHGFDIYKKTFIGSIGETFYLKFLTRNRFIKL